MASNGFKSSGEARWLRVLRGIMATFVLIGIVVYALFNIILAPVREAGMTPFDVYRTATLPSDFRLSAVPVWDILVNIVRFMLSFLNVADYYMDRQRSPTTRIHLISANSNLRLAFNH